MHLEKHQKHFCSGRDSFSYFHIVMKLKKQKRTFCFNVFKTEFKAKNCLIEI